MKKQVITYLLVGIAALPAASQEKLEGTLYVDGEYVPTVVRQDKIHLLPQKVSFELPTFRPEPATGLLTGNYVPGYNALPAPVWQGAAAEYPWRGYLYGGIGSYLNSTLSAGYRMVATDATKADIWFQHTGTSLFKPRICDRDLKRYRYDERLGLRVSHRFSAGTLTADAHYHLGFFNYYGVSTPHSSLIVMPPRMEAKQTDETPKQTLNDARLRASWQESPQIGSGFADMTMASARTFEISLRTMRKEISYIRNREIFPKSKMVMNTKKLIKNAAATF